MPLKPLFASGPREWIPVTRAEGNVVYETSLPDQVLERMPRLNVTILDQGVWFEISNAIHQISMIIQGRKAKATSQAH